MPLLPDWTAGSGTASCYLSITVLRRRGITTSCIYEIIVRDAGNA
jgi:hypothetical protein